MSGILSIYLATLVKWQLQVVYKGDKYQIKTTPESAIKERNGGESGNRKKTANPVIQLAMKEIPLRYIYSC